MWDTLNSGRVIPGFGHAVLRKTDPRYTCQVSLTQTMTPALQSLCSPQARVDIGTFLCLSWA